MGGVACLAQYPATQGDDDIALFGERNEGVRPQQAFLWMLPAQQGFDRDDTQVAQAIARLVVQDEFLILQGAAQVVLQLSAVLDLLVHFGGKVAPGVLAIGLGLVQTDVGAADQLTGIVALAASLGDANAGADAQLLAGEFDGLLQQVDQACAEAVYFAAVVHAVQHQDEFVISQAGDQVDVAGGVTQSRGHFLQDRIPGGVAEGVVDRLEVVQVQ
ncbi:hypothetical protein D3C79_555820 [compost metagenome]